MKFHQNHLSFVEVITKTCSLFFRTHCISYNFEVHPWGKTRHLKIVLSKSGIYYAHIEQPPSLKVYIQCIMWYFLTQPVD